MSNQILCNNNLHHDEKVASAVLRFSWPQVSYYPDLGFRRSHNSIEKQVSG